MSEIEKRKHFTEAKIAEVKLYLDTIGYLVENKACIYATGSFGRNEASESSDLDVFIAGKAEEIKYAAGDSTAKRSLSYLDEIMVKARLIEVTRQLRLPDFDGDGEYLKHYTKYELISSLGRPEDDALNTFTARLLLLLESQPLLNETLYKDAIEGVITAYWRDYEDHRDNFVPTFFVNDVQRLWRTFCVNYEARTRNSPASEKSKRRLKNYKLKYSRLLTCYSPMLCLLFLFSKNNTVHPDDMRSIVEKTPVDRLIWLQSEAGSSQSVNELLDAYEQFLEVTSVPSQELSVKFDSQEERTALLGQAARFGETMHRAILELGGDSTLARHMIV